MKHHLSVRQLLCLIFCAHFPVILAQPSQLQIKMFEIDRFARLNTEEVNFRRLPNSASGKLMEWNSDAGSFYTKTALFFSDQNKGRYRANSNTGAYISAYHVAKGALLPVCSAQGDWLRVEVQGGHRAVQPWVMARFCDLVSVQQTEDGVPVPAYFTHDEEGGEVPGPDAQTVRRESGKYAGLDFSVAFEESYDAVSVCFPFQVLGGRFAVVVRTSMQVDRWKDHTFNVDLVSEAGMDDEEYEELKVQTPEAAGAGVADAVREWMLTCSDADFGKVVRVAFPADGVVNANEAYFISSEGVRESVSLDTSIKGMFLSTVYTRKFIAR